MDKNKMIIIFMFEQVWHQRKSKCEHSRVIPTDVPGSGS